MVSGYEYDHKVAEVKIEKVEKGKISEVVYIRYWSRTWRELVCHHRPEDSLFHRNLKRGRCAGFIWQKTPTTDCRRKATRTGGTMSFLLTVWSQSKNKHTGQVA